ncbi:MAG: sigma-70 family RNA polymerase sigma factor [Acidobacteria bacterium]|nr:sigma-70 family RNA polymerase sigma factor [Acidobacteriota bacterium]
MISVRVPAESAAAALDLASDFDTIVRANQRRIYRVLLALVRDPDVADNLTQECFVRAYEKRRTFRGHSSISTWLTRIAINLARDHARNRKDGFWRSLLRGPVHEAAQATNSLRDARSSPEQALMAREATQIVLDEMAAMPPQQREVFALRFFEELSLEEIAIILDREVGTVKTHLFRAVKRVRSRLSGVTQP